MSEDIGKLLRLTVLLHPQVMDCVDYVLSQAPAAGV
jgi:hypothetical protein